MFTEVDEVLRVCDEKDLELYELVLEDEMKTSKCSKDEVRAKLEEMLEIMFGSARANLDEPSETNMGMIDGFAYKMNEYSKKGDTITGEFITHAMAMGFSTLELSSLMGKIVASPTAGSSGILPAVLTAVKERDGFSNEKLVNAMLTAIGVGKFIGKYGSFAGAEGGCQAETGSASAMGAGALVYLYGGTIEQIFHAASFAFIHVLGLVCDPIAGLVEYPCTFRNASGTINAFISADMALAGIKSIVPFEEVCQAVDKVGVNLPETLRETGLGGLAATDTGREIRSKFLKSNEEL